MDAASTKSAGVRIACMSSLNMYGTHNGRDQTDEAMWNVKLDDMELLDALAGICVRQSSDTYAVALELSSSLSVNVYVASNTTTGVPEEAIGRLKALWDFMRYIQNDPNCAAAAGSHIMEYPDLAQKHRSFFEDQLRYSLPAIVARHGEDARNLLIAMTRALAHDCAIHKADCSGTECAKQRTESNIKFLQDLVDRISDLQSQGTSRRVDLFAILLKQRQIYATIEYTLKDKRSSQFVRHVEHVSRTPVRFLLRRLCWLGAARAVLSSAAHDNRYKQWFQTEPQIIPVPPLPPYRLTLDFLQPNLFNIAERAYHPILTSAGRPPRFEEEWRQCVIEPLRAHFGTAMTDRWVASVDAYQHSECALLEHLVRGGHSCQPYIGTSEPSCVPCWNMFESYNAYSERHFYLRGCSGQSPVVWYPPDVADGSFQTYRLQSGLMAKSLSQIVTSWRQAADAVREV